MGDGKFYEQGGLDAGICITFIIRCVSSVFEACGLEACDRSPHPKSTH